MEEEGRPVRVVDRMWTLICEEVVSHQERDNCISNNNNNSNNVDNSDIWSTIELTGTKRKAIPSYTSISAYIR